MICKYFYPPPEDSWHMQNKIQIPCQGWETHLISNLTSHHSLHLTPHPHPPPHCSSCSSLNLWSSTQPHGFCKCLFPLLRPSSLKPLNDSLPNFRTLLRCLLLGEAWPYDLKHHFSLYPAIFFLTSTYYDLALYCTIICVSCLPCRISVPWRMLSKDPNSAEHIIGTE